MAGRGAQPAPGAPLLVGSGATWKSCHVGTTNTDNNDGTLHDGNAATLAADVVASYNRVRALALTSEQQRDLVEYLILF